ncbi:MAG: hypothetical protein ACREBR_02755, partial [bacterium]
SQTTIEEEEERLGVHARHLDSTFSTIKPEPTRRSYESLQGSSSYYSIMVAPQTVRFDQNQNKISYRDIVSDIERESAFIAKTRSGRSSKTVNPNSNNGGEPTSAPTVVVNAHPITNNQIENVANARENQNNEDTSTPMTQTDRASNTAIFDSLRLDESPVTLNLRLRLDEADQGGALELHELQTQMQRALERTEVRRMAIAEEARILDNQITESNFEPVPSRRRGGNNEIQVAASAMEDDDNVEEENSKMSSLKDDNDDSSISTKKSRKERRALRREKKRNRKMPKEMNLTRQLLKLLVKLQHQL